MNPNDNFLDPAPRDVFYAWAIGFVVALMLAVHGAISIYTRSALWEGDSGLPFGGGGQMPVHGASAVAMGIGFIAAAGVLHFHFFWSWRERFLAFAQVGKVASVIALAGAVLFFIFRFWFD
jgi:hypothetical protein